MSAAEVRRYVIQRYRQHEITDTEFTAFINLSRSMTIGLRIERVTRWVLHAR